MYILRTQDRELALMRHCWVLNELPFFDINFSLTIGWIMSSDIFHTNILIRERRKKVKRYLVIIFSNTNNSKYTELRLETLVWKKLIQKSVTARTNSSLNYGIAQEWCKARRLFTNWKVNKFIFKDNSTQGETGITKRREIFARSQKTNLAV